MLREGKVLKCSAVQNDEDFLAMDPVTTQAVTKAASGISAAVTKSGESFLKAVLHAPLEALARGLTCRPSQ